MMCQLWISIVYACASTSYVLVKCIRWRTETKICALSFFNLFNIEHKQNWKQVKTDWKTNSSRNREKRREKHFSIFFWIKMIDLNTCLTTDFLLSAFHCSRSLALFSWLLAIKLNTKTWKLMERAEKRQKTATKNRKIVKKKVNYPRRTRRTRAHCLSFSRNAFLQLYLSLERKYDGNGRMSLSFRWKFLNYLNVVVSSNYNGITAYYILGVLMSAYCSLDHTNLPSFCHFYFYLLII